MTNLTYEPFYWLNQESRIFLSRGYLAENESPESRIEEIAKTAEKYLKIDGFAEKFISYMAKGFYSLATPVWTNFGKATGLPVSCFGSYIPDSTDSIFEKISEVGMMSKMGGGTSGYFGELRPRGASISKGGKTDGPVRFMELFDKTADVISQGSARRGSFAAYLPVEHPDILEFLKIRSDGHAIQNMSIGVTITDEWMRSMISGDKSKRDIWAKIIQKRYESGYPYVTFIDNVNNNNPEVYKDRNLKVKAKNSFVCVLSSLNLLHWDEIAKTDAIETLIYFLDAVNEEFVVKSKSVKFMEAAHQFAKSHRALGAGVLGWHSFLQSKNIPFESIEAKILNSSIWKTIRSKSDSATQFLAKHLGEPEILKGYGRRNTHTLAVAPTTSSSFILGQISPSIEPLNSNYFVKNLAKGSFTFKNPFLERVLENYNQNTQETWKSILAKGGSVQHLTFLSQKERDTFKTFGEISQKEVVIQASQRQKYIDQGQSLNIMVPLDVSAKEVSQLMIFAWESGIKGLYYQRGANPAQELSRSLNQCKSCEG